jgi:putative bacteriocin precursor
MFLKKANSISKNTIEAYACSCSSVCYGCTITCNPSTCGCDTTFFNNPFANLTNSETSDNKSEVSDSQNPAEWTRFSK